MESFLMKASASLLTAFIVSVISAVFYIPFLHKLKFGQSIRDCGPAAHMKKSGTPTMGGIIMFTGVIPAALLWTGMSPAVVIALVLTLGHAVIGFADDYIKVAMKRNLGLTAREKLACQLALAAAFIVFVEMHFGAAATVLEIPGTAMAFNVGYLYYILVILLLVGTTNAVNLTDGLDGLASSVSIPVLAAYAFIAYKSSLMGLSAFLIAVIGACLGFLVYNHYPAKVFMGDTGSLALGAVVAAAALLTHTELLLILIGGVYVWEAVSVIMQVSYFKITGGKRIFRMTPIHHHFELGGWSENHIVAVFTTISCICSAAGTIIWLYGKGLW